MSGSFFFKNSSNLDGQNFRKEMESQPGSQLIDVRTPGEFATGSINNAINMDILAEDFEQRLHELDNTRTYFVFCHSGARSSAAVKKMKSLGLKAYNLVGGINAWPEQ